MRMPGRTYLKKPCFRVLSVFAILKAYLKQQTHRLCWCKVSGDNHVTKVSVRLYKGYMSQNPTNIQEQKKNPRVIIHACISPFCSFDLSVLPPCVLSQMRLICWSVSGCLVSVTTTRLRYEISDLRFTFYLQSR